MSSLNRLFTVAAVTVLGASSSFAASGAFATSVVQFVPGPSANPSFPAANAIGGPTGGGLANGSVHVCVLGVGGSLTLGFANAIVDGPGADFVAFENALTFGGGVFTEVAAVEVSTDGANFARFPMRYVGPPVAQPPFGTLPMGTFSGVVGGMPILTNVATNAIDPRDLPAGGGEGFDLAELANDPLVVGGIVDLTDVRFVRIVDVPAGTVLDEVGAPIFDHGGSTGSADIDAVAVVRDQSDALAHTPIVDLRIDAGGFLVVEIGDADGFSDLDLATLSASFDLTTLQLASWLPAFTIVGADATKVTLRSIAPTVGSGILGAFAVSARDHAGDLAADQTMLQR
ncbi:MAG: hypothetical protein JNL94_12175 [Planctomycetes bacterium]|nr:hypothetical protein [Planctomycetota bacterium]